MRALLLIAIAVLLPACGKKPEPPPPPPPRLGPAEPLAGPAVVHRYHLPGSSGRLLVARVDGGAEAVAVVPSKTPAPLATIVPAAGDLVAVNGGFYDDKGAPMGLVIANGREVHRLTRMGGSGIFSVSDGVPSIVHRDAYGPDRRPEQALQSIDRLVDAGGSLVRNRDGAPRDAHSAVAIDARGGVFFAIAFDDRTVADEKDGVIRLNALASSYGPTLGEWAELLIELGADTALNLDGGKSTSFVVRAGARTVSVVAADATINALVAKPR